MAIRNSKQHNRGLKTAFRSDIPSARSVQRILSHRLLVIAVCPLSMGKEARNRREHASKVRQHASNTSMWNFFGSSTSFDEESMNPLELLVAPRKTARSEPSGSPFSLTIRLVVFHKSCRFSQPHFCQEVPSHAQRSGELIALIDEFDAWKSFHSGHKNE